MAKRKRLSPLQSPVERPNENTDKASAALLANSSPPIARVAAEASATAALQELSQTLRRARAEGRMVTMLPLAQIDQGYLERDRIMAGDEDMDALKASIAARGQQTPIEVVELGENRFGLISGWRRLQALYALDLPEAKALITQPRDASDAYVAMIEENEIRVGLSYFERARMVLKSVELGIFDSHKTALQTLFASASRAKRSKIKSFILVVEALGDALRYPAQMGERMGLQLSKALSANGATDARLRRALEAGNAQSFEEEQKLLNDALTGAGKADEKPQAKAKTDNAISVSGVTLRASAQSISLTGRGVDAQLAEDLLAWLRGRES